jgi:aryl carrier-like protein
MSYTEWSESIRPKVQGSWNLHSALPSGLDFFILLSSVCGIFGNGGQSNYAAGNTFQDALARWLVERGEKAVSLNLGIILGEGFVAENKQVMDRLLRLDILTPISQSELFAMLDYYCNPSMRFSSPAQSQAITGLELPANLRAKGLEPPLSLCAPMFSHMHQISGAGQVSLAGDEQTQDTKSLLVKTSSLEEAGTVVAEALRGKVCRVLGVSPDQMSLSSQLESYGVDSLVALELRNWLAKETRADVAVFEILGGPSLIDVGMMAARKSELKQASWTE